MEQSQEFLQLEMITWSFTDWRGHWLFPLFNSTSMSIKLPSQVSSRQLGMELQGWVRAGDTDLGMTGKCMAYF